MSVKYRTFADMITYVGEVVGNEGDTKKSLIKSGINTWYDHIVNRFRWPALMLPNDDGVTISSGGDLLYLAKYVERVYFFHFDKSHRTVPLLDMQGFYSRFPVTHSTNGVVQDVGDAGESGRMRDFHTSAETITVVSSSAADTGKVMVHGQVGNDIIGERVTLTGTSSVATTNSFTDLHRVTTDGDQVGVVTFSGTTSGNTYATVAPGESTAVYRTLRLHFVPDDTDTLRFYGKRMVNQLVNDEDVPQIPVSGVLQEYGCMHMFAHQRKWQEAAQHHRVNAEQMLAEITKDIEDEDRFEQSYPDRVYNRTVPSQNRYGGGAAWYRG